jgi:hypothetical protein
MTLMLILPTKDILAAEKTFFLMFRSNTNGKARFFRSLLFYPMLFEGNFIVFNLFVK